ncbi:hypothetical protein GCM10016455_22590 [Aliiroseovarius zhejiangensis]|uniref:Uncharacterized protein n=1 Tax=Aliiroseovarius zhejiangensis TaxID=1632025 RepID=A0ABQ3J4G9_9RHOB|nr:hypothetical protein [Aliiroseovarius zhejiangensis]GHF01019.1 hypothetical protein GCM10016455_22590 [Aliiroseovarius zhejiangensis]
MNALVIPVAPLANAIAEVITAVQSAAHRFLTSDCVPTWTEYLRGCNK